MEDPHLSSNLRHPHPSYKQLDIEKHEIRLLTIQSGKGSDPVVVSTEVASLIDSPQYEALSYAWGDGKITKKPIILCDQTVSVTFNLYTALRRLRQPKSIRTIWIDQLSINQTDLEERKNQVKLMSQIYTRCSKCIIWLGDEDSTTKEAIGALEAMAENSHLNAFEGYADSSLANLFRRSWWTRQWTIQETLLPKSKEIMCGPKSLSWDKVILAMLNLNEPEVGCCCHLYRLGDHHNAMPSYHALIREFHAFSQVGIQTNLFGAVHLFRSRQVTDPRD